MSYTMIRLGLVLALSLPAVFAGCASDDAASGGADTGGTTGDTGGTTGDTGGTTGDTGGTPDDTGGTTGDTGGTPDDTGGTTGDTAQDTGGTTAPTCEAYCDAVTAACTGDNAQYADKASCLAYCGTAGALPLGAAGDTSGNTVGCRTYHAGVAGSAPGDGTDDTHCPHAGPSGANVCGTWCENYCHLAMTNCTGDAALYADQEACTIACAGIPVADAPNPTKVTGGDSIECRIYHLGVAGTDGATSAAVHCPHAAVDGGGVCVDVDAFDFRADPAADYDRVDRMGMPAVATALIASKDAYNAADPADDAAGTFVPELQASVAAIHGALDDDLASFGLTPCAVADCLAAGAPLVLPDTLKLGLDQPAGFPNGRGLADPAIDVTLAVILLDLNVHGPTDLVGALNPSANDVPFLTDFPYLALPHAP